MNNRKRVKNTTFLIVYFPHIQDLLQTITKDQDFLSMFLSKCQTANYLQSKNEFLAVHHPLSFVQLHKNMMLRCYVYTDRSFFA